MDSKNSLITNDSRIGELLFFIVFIPRLALLLLANSTFSEVFFSD